MSISHERISRRGTRRRVAASKPASRLARLACLTATVDVTAQIPVQRVSTLELFFDLVFVFTITQLTAVLTHDPSLGVARRSCSCSALIWWMYGGYAWLTNAVSHARLRQLASCSAAWRGYLVLALAIPDAFDGSGLAFGLGYLVVVAVHATLFIWTRVRRSRPARSSARAVQPRRRVLVIVGGALGGTAQYVLWRSPRVLEWVTPWVANRESQSSFVIAPAHFVERHGLVVIVAIGESVVAVGIGAAGLAVDAELVARRRARRSRSARASGGSTSAATTTSRPSARSPTRPPARQPWIALEAFGVAHYFLLLGIVARGRGDQEGHRARLRPAGDRRGVRPRRRRRALPRRRRRLPPHPRPRALAAPRGRRAAGPGHDPAGHARSPRSPSSPRSS